MATFGSEQRKELRFVASNLPQEYQRFSILLNQGIETFVETIDASTSGFGFLCPLPVERFILGTKLVLFPLGNDHPVYGVVRFVIHTDIGTRVGVSLQNLGGYERYKAVIERLYSVHFE